MADVNDRHGGDLRLRVAFDSLASAQNGIEVLGRSGVEGNHLMVEENRAAAIAEPTVAGQAGADDKLVRKLGRKAGGGIVIGAVLGALLGVVFGLVLFGARPPTVGLTVGGAIVFGLLGLVLGGYTAVDVSPAWEATVQGGEGPAVLAVNCQTQSEKELVTSALEGAGGRVLPSS